MVTITFQTEPNNADLQRLLDLARRFKLPFQIAEKSKKTKKDVLNDIEAAMLEVQHKNRTGQQGQSIESFLKTTNDTPPTKSEFLADFKDSLLWAKQHDAGKVEHQQSFDDFLNALESEIEAEKILA